jgi:hypothetical protein
MLGPDQEFAVGHPPEFFEVEGQRVVAPPGVGKPVPELERKRQPRGQAINTAANPEAELRDIPLERHPPILKPGPEAKPVAREG